MRSTKKKRDAIDERKFRIWNRRFFGRHDWYQEWCVAMMLIGVDPFTGKSFL